MVPSQCPQHIFVWSHRDHSRPQCAICCQSQLLVSVCKVPRWLWGGQGAGSCDLPSPLHRPPLSGKYSARHLLQRQYQGSPDCAPGKKL